jgi:glycosyltransferase involved in cell wall biosynthesis
LGAQIIKICVICSGFSSIYGGVETPVFKLSELWAKNGYEVCIISGRGKRTGPKGVRLIKLPFIPRKYFPNIPLLTRVFPNHELEGFSFLPSALLCLMGVDPDIVLSNQIGETFPALILGKPSIMISQAPIKMRFNTFKRASRVIVETPLSQEIIRKYGIDTDVILYGVDTSKTAEVKAKQLRLKYGISDNSIIILTVAQLVPHKRINLLIEAFKLIEQSATLIIVGEGSDLSRLRKQAHSANLDNKIIFVKPMPHNQLMEFYQLCDIFTLPSVCEPFGIVFIEALSFGKIIVTNLEPEAVKRLVIGNFGVFTNVNDPIEYSKSLVQAASMRIDVSSAEYIQHMQKFNWNDIAFQYEKIFHEVFWASCLDKC